MTYTVGWGIDEALPDRQPRIEVSTSDELDTALVQVATSRTADDLPVVVDMFAAGESRTGVVMQFGVGYSRSFVLWLDPKNELATGWGYEPGLEPADEPVMFEYGGQPVEYEPERLCVAPETARAAAREFVMTGARPTVVSWRTDQPVD